MVVKGSDVCINSDRSKDEAGYILGNIFVVLICIGCTAFNLYNVWRFYKKSRDDQFAQRRPKLTIAIVLLSVPITLFDIPFAINFYTFECVAQVSVFRQVNSNGEDTQFTRTWEEILLVSAFMAIFAWAFTIVTKVWILRYEYERNRAIRSSDWRKSLEMTGNKSADWYSSHRSTYGNELWVLKVLTIPYILCILLFILVSPIMTYIKDWTYLSASVSTCLALTLAVIVLNVYKIRNIHDNFQVRNEIMLMAKYSLCYALAQLVAFGVGRSGNTVYDYTTLISGIVFQTLFLGVNYIQTGWIIRALGNSKIASQVTANDEDQVNLTTFVSTEDGFEAFMEMLVGEFSTENLLCYVECTQFLRKWREEFKKLVLEKMAATSSISRMTEAMVKQNGSNDPQSTVLQRIGTTFMKEVNKAVDNLTLAHSSSIIENTEVRKKRPDSLSGDEELLGWCMSKDFVNAFPFLPESVIINTDLTLYEHVRYLHTRYIRDSSQYQVNISSSYHREWADVINNKEDCRLDNFDPQQIPALRTEEHGDVAMDGRVQSLSISVDKTDQKTDQKPDRKTEQKNEKTRSRKSQQKGVLKVLNLVENTRKDLWKLMQDSYLRFRGTHEYMVFVKNMKPARSDSKV